MGGMPKENIAGPPSNLQDGPPVHWTGMALEGLGGGETALMVELVPAAVMEGRAWYMQVCRFPQGTSDVQKRALTPEGVELVWAHMGIPETAFFHWTGREVEPEGFNPFYPRGTMSMVRDEYHRWNGSWDDPVRIHHALLRKHGETSRKAAGELCEGDTFFFNGQLATAVRCRCGTKYLTCTYTSDGKHTGTWKSPLEALIEVTELPGPVSKTRWDRLLED